MKLGILPLRFALVFSFSALTTQSLEQQKCRGEPGVEPQLTQIKRSGGSNDVDSRVAAFRSRLTKYKSRIYNEIKWGRILTAGISSVCQLKMLALHTALNEIEIPIEGKTLLKHSQVGAAVTQLSAEMKKAWSSFNGMLGKFEKLQQQKMKEIKSVYRAILNEGGVDIVKSFLDAALQISGKICNVLITTGANLKNTNILAHELMASFDADVGDTTAMKKLLKSTVSELEIFSSFAGLFLQYEQFDQFNLKILGSYFLTTYQRLPMPTDMINTSTVINQTTKQRVFENQLFVWEHPFAVVLTKQIYNLTLGAIKTIFTAENLKIEEVQELVIVKDMKICGRRKPGNVNKWGN